MQFSLLSTVFLLGAAQGVFLALALLSAKQGLSRANRYLALLTLLFVGTLLDYFLDETVLTAQYPWLRVLIWPKEFFYGACIYLYTCELTQRKPAGRASVHFLPALLHIAVAWPMLALPSETQLLLMTHGEGLSEAFEGWFFVLDDFEQSLALGHLGIYLVLSLRHLALHRRRIANELSYTEKVSLLWLRNLLLAIIILYGLWFCSHSLSWEGQWEQYLDLGLGLGLVLLIYAMAYSGLRQVRIFEPLPNEPLDARTKVQPEPIDCQELEDSPEPVAPAYATNELRAQLTDKAQVKAKYLKSSLSAELSASLATELNQLMAEHACYLDAELSLPQLAEKLSVSTNYLSQTINEQFGQNFFDYINQQRIDYAAGLLVDSDMAVVDVAVAAGFNSKSAFYTAFKKYRHLTPAAYRKQAKAELIQ